MKSSVIPIIIGLLAAAGSLSAQQLPEQKSRLTVGGYSKNSDAYRATEKFYYLSTSDREAVIAFVDAI